MNMIQLLLVFFIMSQSIFASSKLPSVSDMIKTPEGLEQIQEIHQTHYGNLLILSDTSTYIRETIFFNNKIVFHKAVSFISILAKSFQNGKEIILFSTSCGGSSCPEPDKLYLLIINANKNTEVITSNDFYKVYGESTEPIIQNNKVKIDLGYENKKHKIATLIDDRLKVEYSEEKNPISSQDCENLYEWVSSECLEFKKNDLDCNKQTDPYIGVSLVAMSWIRALSHHPLLNHEALNHVCRRMCETDIAITYGEFKSNVCSIK